MMRDQITFPLYVQDRETKYIRKYDNILSVGSDLELIDIQNNEYEAWDSSGTAVELFVNSGVIEAAPAMRRAKTLDEALQDMASAQNIHLMVDASYEVVYDQMIANAKKKWKLEPWWKRFLKRW